MAEAPAELTPRQRTAFVALCVLFTAVVIPLGLRNGLDLTTELPQSERLLAGTPLYTSNPDIGIYWPPFTIAGLIPFALLARASAVLAKVVFALLNVACLAWCVARVGRLWGWRPAIVSVLAVAKPVIGNFVWLNLGVFVLVLVVAAAADLAEGRERPAGVWLGIATALKAFPALLLLYLAYRRRWRGFATGVAVAGALTLVPGLRYGPLGALTTAWEWFTVSRRSQLLEGFRGQPLGGFLVEQLGAPWPAVVGVTLLCFSLVLVTLHRLPANDERLPYGFGMVAILAALIAPIGWNYNFVMALPAWITVLALPTPARWRPAWIAALIAAGLLLSGLLTFHAHFNNVLGALLLLAALAAYPRAPAPVPAYG